MAEANRILDVNNDPIALTGMAGAFDGIQQFAGLPLGTSADSASGELAVKVKVVSSVAPSSGTARTPTITLVSTDGSVAAGSRGLTLILSSDFAGTILGATFSGATTSSLTIPVPDGDTLGAVDYTISAGSMLIVRVA